LAARFTPRITGPDAVADGVVLRARLFLARQLGLDAAQLHDDVAVLEPLDDAAHHFADTVAVLGVDVVALGLADLLEDDLLGGLRGDPAQVLGRARELDLHVDFRFLPVELLRSASEIWFGGSVTSSTMRFHGAELDLPRLRY
jgi:hypothetical protein